DADVAGRAPGAQLLRPILADFGTVVAGLQGVSLDREDALTGLALARAFGVLEVDPGHLLPGDQLKHSLVEHLAVGRLDGELVAIEGQQVALEARLGLAVLLRRESHPGSLELFPLLGAGRSTERYG